MASPITGRFVANAMGTRQETRWAARVESVLSPGPHQAYEEAIQVAEVEAKRPDLLEEGVDPVQQLAMQVD